MLTLSRTGRRRIGDSKATIKDFELLHKNISRFSKDGEMMGNDRLPLDHNLITRICIVQATVDRS